MIFFGFLVTNWWLKTIAIKRNGSVWLGIGIWFFICILMKRNNVCLGNNHKWMANVVTSTGNGLSCRVSNRRVASADILKRNVCPGACLAISSADESKLVELDRVLESWWSLVSEFCLLLLLLLPPTSVILSACDLWCCWECCWCNCCCFWCCLSK